MKTETVRKTLNSKAKVGDALGIAQQAAYPAIVGARYALILSLLAVVLSVVALGVAL